MLSIMIYPQLAPIFCCRLLDIRGNQKHHCTVLQCNVACGLCSVAGGLVSQSWAIWFRSVGKRSVLSPFSYGGWEECMHLDTPVPDRPNPVIQSAIYGLLGFS